MLELSLIGLIAGFLTWGFIHVAHLPVRHYKGYISPEMNDILDEVGRLPRAGETVKLRDGRVFRVTSAPRYNP